MASFALQLIQNENIYLSSMPISYELLSCQLLIFLFCLFLIEFVFVRCLRVKDAIFAVGYFLIVEFKILPFDILSQNLEVE